jgi:hypothetical protein
VEKPGFYVAVYNKGGNQKVGVLEDTIMSEKEARERAGCRRNQCSPHPSHQRQYLRYHEGNPTRFEKVKPECLGQREAGCETSSQGGQ